MRPLSAGIMLLRVCRVSRGLVGNPCATMLGLLFRQHIARSRISLRGGVFIIIPGRPCGRRRARRRGIRETSGNEDLASFEVDPTNVSWQVHKSHVPTKGKRCQELLQQGIGVEPSI